jgi:hypothetical protein
LMEVSVPAKTIFSRKKIIFFVSNLSSIFILKFNSTMIKKMFAKARVKPSEIGNKIVFYS